MPSAVVWGGLKAVIEVCTPLNSQGIIEDGLTLFRSAQNDT